MAQALTPAPPDWAGEGVSLGEVESAVARLRLDTTGGQTGPNPRTSVATHLVWAPEEWLEKALATLAGLGERHPSRTIFLTPAPGEPDGIDARVGVSHTAAAGPGDAVVSEVIRLRLRGVTSQAPASVVMPLLISDLPVFCRWRGQPPFGDGLVEQLCGVTDRLIVDSGEWDGIPAAYGRLAELFAHVSASDLAWARLGRWQVAIARLWPELRDVSRLEVTGPRAEALLLHGWLLGRLGTPVALAHGEADRLERVVVDDREVEVEPEPRTPSDFLSDEFDRFGRDALYEASVFALLRL